jgi:hypothetical protein
MTNKATKPDWTFMVYIAGDNNLDPAALQDIAEMAKVGSSKDLNVVVQLDRARDQKTRRFYITKGGGYSKDCVETFGETNTGDQAVLEAFIRWAMEKYPAKRYALVIWNHGGGWWDVVADRAKRNIAYDDSSDGDSLNNQELQAILSNVSQLQGKKIDLLGMDACLMAMVEVAYQLRDSVQITVGSEEEEPFEGWPYDQVLKVLKNKPRTSAPTLAREIVKAYVKSYVGTGNDVTQSAFNLQALWDVVSDIDALSEELIGCLNQKEVLDAITLAKKASPSFFGGYYIDLYRFAQVLKTKCSQSSIKTKADTLLKSLGTGSKKTILCQQHYGSELKSTHGMSIYFPKWEINPKYQDLDFYHDCQWGEFLEKYLNLSQRHKDLSQRHRDHGVFGQDIQNDNRSL